jgi:CSLREA domain-containing protein
VLAAGCRSGRIALVGLWLAAGPTLAATITVNSAADTAANDGVCTLREAIIAANTDTASGAMAGECAAGSGSDTIVFSIPGAGVHTIVLGSALPTITTQITIDGYTQPGASANTLAVGDDAVILIELDASALPSSTVVMNVTGSNSTIRGLDIHGNAGTNLALIAIQGGDNNAIEGNFIGIDPTGTAGSSGNGNGVAMFFPVGVNNRVGGPAPAQRNVISGNGGGITVSQVGAGTTIQGNYVGTNAAGTAALPNFTGMQIQPSGDTTIGGAVAGAGNLVSGNTSGGIQIVPFLAPAPVTIQGNFIGVNAAGTAALGNGGIGVWINEAPGSVLGPILVGGTAAGAGNVISGNQLGILSTGTSVTIQGNRVGTNAAGTAAIGNTQQGVNINGASSFFGDAVVGGNTAAARNVISGNNDTGVEVVASTATIQGNYIGTAIDGTTPLPNAVHGVRIDSGAATVGGPGAGEGNLIANNGGTGVLVNITFAVLHNASNAEIRGNSIVNNGQLGIDLSLGSSADLVTPNDPGDADAGPNNLQNFPMLGTPTIAAGNVTLSGSLNSTPTSDFVLDFYSTAACDASGNGEGTTYLGSRPVSTDGTGNASFAGATFPIPPGQTFITATATDTNSPPSTSEFGACVSPAGALPTLSINNVTANEGNSGITPFVFTVTLSAPSASTVTVNFATADGTASSASDYITTFGTLTFNPGVLTQTITVNVGGDTTVEPDETFFVNLSAPTNATIAVGTGTGTIVNDDAASLPTLSINSVSLAEGNSGTTPFVFTVTLSAASASTVTVNYATADGTATAPSDYGAAAGTLTFAPGATTRTITVGVVGDTVVEPNKTFSVNLSAPTNATIAAATGTGTILDDDSVAPPASTPIPTLSDWALVTLGAILLVTAMSRLRRRDR